MAKNLDVLTLTAAEASQLLATGTITSVDLVHAYLSQISQHNHAGLHLNALISLAPTSLLLSHATKLDAERASGHLRSPLHGIPILLKDTYLTSTISTGLPTTAGSPCFLSSTSTQNSPLVQKLLDAGPVILGKTNMTEFCGLKYTGMTPGWSPAGGQTQSPYIFGGLAENESLLGHSSPGGSSSGSAVGVAAGFAPLTLGTEAVGSVVTPANRAGLYALRCGGGTVDGRGNFRFAEGLDYVGCMGKSAEDVARLAAVVMGREHGFGLLKEAAVEDVRVGFLDPGSWLLPEEVCPYPGDTKQQMLSGYRQAVGRVSGLGVQVVEDLELALPWDKFKTAADESLFYETSSKWFA